jgi:hypothetical protein
LRILTGRLANEYRLAFESVPKDILDAYHCCLVACFLFDLAGFRYGSESKKFCA